MTTAHKHRRKKWSNIKVTNVVVSFHNVLTNAPFRMVKLYIFATIGRIHVYALTSSPLSEEAIYAVNTYRFKEQNSE